MTKLEKILARDGKSTDVIAELRKSIEEIRIGSGNPLTFDERLALASRNILAREKKK